MTTTMTSGIIDRRRWVRFLLALVVSTPFLVLTALWAQSPAPQEKESPALTLDKQIISDAKNNSELLQNLTYLSDVIGPRLTGSANLKKANDWAAEKMKGYGLSDVHLEPWEIPIGWERGTATARIVEPGNGISLTVAAMGWTPGTNGKIVGDVVALTGRTVQDFKPFEGKLKNAIVLRGEPAAVRPINDLSGAPNGDRQGPGQRERPGRNESKDKAKGDDPKGEKTEENAKRRNRPGGFDNRGEDFMRNRREVAEFLRHEGVVAMLNDSAKPHGLLNMSGSWGGRDRISGVDPLPTLFVTHDHYSLLHRLATRPGPAKTRVEIEITNTMVPGPLAVYNTVGEIRGSDKPDEFVVVGAHLDSWDLGQGTTDNGTGSCVVLETARILAKCGVTPKRSIRFVLFTGEEQGLHGSKAYVDRHKDELAKASAAIVHDTGTGKIIGLSLQDREAIKPIMENELSILKELGVTEISLRSTGGSDHVSFEGAGVPGFMFRQDPAEYRLTHHSQSDTLDKAREPDLIQGAQVMAVLAMRLANRVEMLPRTKPVREKPEGKTTDSR